MAERGVPTTYLLDAYTSIVGLWRLLKHGSQRRLIAFLAHALRFQVATGASKCAVVDEPLQQWQQISLTAMGLDVRTYDSAAAYEAAEGEFPALFESAGAKVISSGSGAKVPTPAASFAARVMESEWRTNELTGRNSLTSSWMAYSPSTSACQWEPASCRRRTLSWPVPRCLRRLLSCPAAVAAMALAAVVAPVAAAAAATRTDTKAW